MFPLQNLARKELINDDKLEVHISCISFNIKKAHSRGKSFM